jgi:hypothetical protein
MTIIDRSGNVSAAMREFVKRRLLFALSRFTAKIAHVSVSVSGVGGPRGGLERLCRVSVRLRRLGRVSVSSQDAETETSVARAAERAGRAVARRVEQHQRFSPSRGTVV